MKKIIILICLVLTFSSCEIQYDGETRIVVEGQLIDKDGNSLSNKKIEINALGDGYIATDLISYTNTDQNGKFSLAFPSPKTDNLLMISINENEKNELQYKQIIALKKNFKNYKLNLNQVILYQETAITQLQLILKNTTTSKQLTDIKIEGLQANYYTDLNPIIATGNYTPPPQTVFDVLKNQNITLSYTVIDYSGSTAVITKYNENITINTEKVTHIITY